MSPFGKLFPISLHSEDPWQLSRGPHWKEDEDMQAQRLLRHVPSPFEMSVLWASVRHGLHYKLVPSDRSVPVGLLHHRWKVADTLTF